MFQQMLIKAFSTASTQRIKQTGASLFYVVCNAMQNGRSQSALLFLHKKKLLHFAAMVTKMHFVGSNSQAYYDKDKLQK